jgi:hypothetical protein
MRFKATSLSSSGRSYSSAGGTVGVVVSRNTSDQSPCLAEVKMAPRSAFFIGLLFFGRVMERKEGGRGC